MSRQQALRAVISDARLGLSEADLQSIVNSDEMDLATTKNPSTTAIGCWQSQARQGARSPILRVLLVPGDLTESSSKCRLASMVPVPSSKPRWGLKLRPGDILTCVWQYVAFDLWVTRQGRRLLL